MQQKDEKRGQKLALRRKIVIAKSDVGKRKRAEASIAMELRRMTRKQRTLQSQIDDTLKKQKKIANDLRLAEMTLRSWQKQLDRIT